MRAPIGFRIRNRRQVLKISQAALARSVGISPSYLNLIEASKRDVGGTLLRNIASELGVELGDLTGEAEQRLMNGLREAFADPVAESFGLGEEDAHRLLAQMPNAAAALHRIYRSYLDASAEADAAINRLRSDPVFAGLLHKMLGQITAVRSGAEILADTPDLDEADQARFLRSIIRESSALSEAAQTLVGQFDEEAGARRSVTPSREVDDLLVEERNYFPALEDEAARLRAEVEEHGGIFGEASLRAWLEGRFGITATSQGEDGDRGASAQARYDAAERRFVLPAGATAAARQFQLARLAAELAARDRLAMMADDDRLSGPVPQALLVRALGAYVAGAMIMPYEAILSQAKSTRYDLAAIGQAFLANFEHVAHRLVTLRRPGAEGIPFGLLRADPSGRVTRHFSLPGLVLPHTGHPCPLWAIFEAFHTPERVVRQTAAFSDGSRYMFVALASAKRVTRYAERPFYTAVMLACDALHADETVYGEGLPPRDSALDVPVGPTCRLCVRGTCPHRQEAMLAQLGQNPAVHGPLIAPSTTLGEAVE